MNKKRLHIAWGLLVILGLGVWRLIVGPEKAYDFFTDHLITLIIIVLAIDILLVVFHRLHRRSLKQAYLQAVRAFEEGDFDESLRAFRPLRRYKNNPSMLSFHSSILAAQAQLKDDSQAQELITQALDLGEKAITLKPDMPEAWHDVGFALLIKARKMNNDAAKEYLTQACHKFEQAVILKPNFPVALSNWASTLTSQAIRSEGSEREALLQQAETKCLQAEEIKKGEGAYHLAGVYAVIGDEAKCRQWLVVAEAESTLLSYREAMISEALAAMRDKDWFKAIRWKGE